MTESQECRNEEIILFKLINESEELKFKLFKECKESEDEEIRHRLDEEIRLLRQLNESSEEQHKEMEEHWDEQIRLLRVIQERKLRFEIKNSSLF